MPDIAAPQADGLDIGLADLQRRLLSAIVDIDRVCTAHGIGYTLIAGSLLGAVRHGGFIPWDDDLDIGMLREDYDRFLSVAAVELGPAYYVQTMHSDPKMGFPFAKVKVNGTTLIEEYAAGTGEHTGVFVDIFPFDNVPDSRIGQRWQALSLKVLGAMLLARTGFQNWRYGSPLMRIIKREIILRAARLIPRDSLVRWLDRTSRRFNRTSTTHVVATGGSYGYHRETVPREWVVETEKAQFGSAFLWVSRHRHAFLARLYGDYMTPPPLAERRQRHGVFSEHSGPVDADVSRSEI